ncbi:MAG TPA: hypothetical protein VKA78_13200 [Pyrinomonadaceae bacterium]|nr:hypothetical protein [Pyrinomonadaceae bacterium]
MKRCPQCLFLYPESDERCDFDQTPLEVVDDAEIDRATNPAKPVKPVRRVLPAAAAIGLLLLGAIIFAIYYGFSRQTRSTSAATQTSITVEPSPIPTPSTLPSPSPSPVVSPSPSPSPSPKPSANGISTAHTRSTPDPVSTSGPGIGTRQGSKPVIMLTSGGKIDADEVWRTKDGVWYRRNGMVTLLKRNQVKAIVTK